MSIILLSTFSNSVSNDNSTVSDSVLESELTVVSSARLETPRAICAPSPNGESATASPNGLEVMRAYVSDCGKVPAVPRGSGVTDASVDDVFASHTFHFAHFLPSDPIAEWSPPQKGTMHWCRPLWHLSASLLQPPVLYV